MGRVGHILRYMCPITFEVITLYIFAFVFMFVSGPVFMCLFQVCGFGIFLFRIAYMYATMFYILRCTCIIQVR